MMRGGDSGPALEPGDPEASRLIEVDPLRRRRPDAAQGQARRGRDRRPDPMGQAGAAWPESTAEAPAPAAPAARVDHGRGPRVLGVPADRRTRRPPAVADASWPRSPIDRFILARLEAKGLRPGRPGRQADPDPPRDVRPDRPAADARGGRRVPRRRRRPTPSRGWSTGCSPRPITASAGAGTGSTSPATARTRPTRSRPGSIPYGYRYRDWVIKALNDDMPYDRFVVEQIAGDLLDGPGRRRRSAGRRSGFFALGPVYYGGAGARRVRRPGRHAHPRLPGPDRRLRPLPRPQVRPDPAARLLRPGGRLRQHRLQGISPGARGCRSSATTRPRPKIDKKNAEIKKQRRGRDGQAKVATTDKDRRRRREAQDAAGRARRS